MNGQGAEFRWPALALMFLAGVLLLILRNPDPLIHPVVYAEDGVWAASGLREGWLHALLHARQDYFVFLNVALLFLATEASRLISGGTIEYLPYTIAAVSHAFLAALACLAFLTVRRVAGSLFGVLAFLLVLLMPLGVSQNEIIGRLLQSGFLMPALAVMLFFWRDRMRSRLCGVLADVLIVAAAGTNPVVFVLALGYFLKEILLEQRGIIAFLKKNLLLLAALAALGLALAMRFTNTSGLSSDMNMSNLFEALTARSVLFPFVFPYYRFLSDFTSLALLAVFGFIVFRALRLPGNPEAKALMLGVLGAGVIYTVMTLAMRPGLTGLLNDYSTSFPDRYFMGVNVLFAILLVLAAARLFENAGTRVMGGVIAASLVVIYAAGAYKIFEFSKSRMLLQTGLSFREQICTSKELPGAYQIQIYPNIPGWVMIVPERYVSKDGCSRGGAASPQS